MPKLLALKDRLSREATSAGHVEPDDVTACCITLRGRVQGFGVRPAIARLALELGLSGCVGNCNQGVVAHVEGRPDSVRTFRNRLPPGLPPGAHVEACEVEAVTPTHCREFRIDPTQTAGQLSAKVPPDIAVCPKCLADVAQPGNRRHGYVFTTCTNCGPRYSLIRAMPYDRQSTSMASFEPCADCTTEYRRPDDRRFHSQTNCCPSCGPQVWLTGATGQVIGRGDQAIERAAVAVRQGNILGLRGVGGYQLVVDATSAAAVAELRARKQRFGKPLALMVADLDSAQRLAHLGASERETLAAPANPIVVLPARTSSPLAADIAAPLHTIGLMLPTTPLHDELLRRARRPLVVTSGNLEGDPLVFDADAARRELGGVVDLWIQHDRPIVRPIDDSVVRVMAGQAATMRLARGLAPLPLEVVADRPILALGGHQKAAIALANGVQAALGPHVGDLQNEATRARYLRHVEAMCQLYDARPRLLVHDLHPDYFTTRWASEQNIPALAVQHHHAHVAAGMLERGWLDRQVLGIAWDGTGYGTDGTIWGGEFLLATATDFRRVAHLRPFDLPGRDLAIRQPWRVALALVHQACGAQRAAQLRFPQVTSQQVEQIIRLLEKPNLFPRTTSAGRLFDGVAALALGISQSQFEGQPAMLLEAACDESVRDAYEMPLCPGEPAVLDWRPLIAAILADLTAEVLPSVVATKFHRALATGIAAVAGQFAEMPVVLTGGCFQNRLLTELAVQRMARPKRSVSLPGLIPVGDGGLAAGQLAIATARIRGGLPCA